MWYKDENFIAVSLIVRDSLCMTALLQEAQATAFLI
jgi:hypothetical protein